MEWVRALISWLNQTCLDLGLTRNQCDQAVPGLLLTVLSVAAGGLFFAARWAWSNRPKGYRKVTPLKPAEPSPQPPPLPSPTLLPEGFIDREEELRLGTELIDNWTKPVIEWWGVPQIGKSRLLEALREMHRRATTQEGKPVYTVTVNLGTRPYAGPTWLEAQPLLFEEISRQLSLQASREIRVETEEDFKKLYDMRLTFFFDAVEGAHPLTLKWLGDTFILECSNVRAIFASRYPLLTAAWNANYQLKKKVDQKKLKPFSPEDTRKQIITELDHDGALARAVFELTAGHPAMAHKLLAWMRDQGIAESVALMQAREKVGRQLERVLHQCLLADLPEDVQSVLPFIAHLRCFLPEELHHFLPRCNGRYEGRPLADFDDLTIRLCRSGLAGRDGNGRYVLENVVRRPMLHSVLVLRAGDFARIRRTLSEMYDERAWRFPDILAFCLCEKLYHLTRALQAEGGVSDGHLAGTLLHTLQNDLDKLEPMLKIFQARRLYDRLSEDLEFQGCIPDIYPSLLQVLEGAMMGEGGEEE